MWMLFIIVICMIFICIIHKDFLPKMKMVRSLSWRRQPMGVWFGQFSQAMVRFGYKDVNMSCDHTLFVRRSTMSKIISDQRVWHLGPSYSEIFFGNWGSLIIKRDMILQWIYTHDPIREKKKKMDRKPVETPTKKNHHLPLSFHILAQLAICLVNKAELLALLTGLI